ncbi:hypothetical protein [Oceanobacillus luteolus]|uniref:Uncharacterized protein n=1 Tax=Oceanobacillus luteolus TaxID=1274358 RepID=A0ABW4HQ30_9BACI
MMKRIGVLSLSMIFIFTSAITSVSANDETANHLEGVQINYETQLGHENRTKEDIVEELVKNGLSIEEAEYYAKIDILTNQLEKNDITVDFSDVEDYSNAYVKANHEELANEALDNLDKKALKAILSKNESLNAGIDDLQQVQEFINQQNKREQNTNANHIIKLKYDDGSELIFEGSTTKDNEISDSVIPQTELSGPWSRSVNFGNTINDRDDNGGSYTSRATWRYKSGSSYASVSDVLKW